MPYPTAAHTCVLSARDKSRGLTHTRKVVNPSVTINTEVQHVRINGSRIWNDILETASFGGVLHTTGMNRLALSASDKAVRDLFIKHAKEINCDIKVDQVGNIFAIRPGRQKHLPPIGMGSHLDTQPNGMIQPSYPSVLC
jgi:hypothetical protein